MTQQESSPDTSTITMAQAPTIAMALASPTPSIDILMLRDGDKVKASFSADPKHADALLTPPNSISPNMPAHGAHGIQPTMASPPLISIEEEIDLEDRDDKVGCRDLTPPLEAKGTPLSKGALSGLDASAVITPAMLARDHLPDIMLGNGPRPIRFVIGALTQTVPGFSRIPPAKARRIVVAALENRSGGGPDGNVAFCKTGWGRWDAHVKGASRDSAIGSLQEGRLSPPRSEHSYTRSYPDSGVHLPDPRRYHDQHSGESWTNSTSIREEDELDMDLDVPEDEADKMSLDDANLDDDSSSVDDATDEEDWAAVGSTALRKASLPTHGAPKRDYQALSIPITGRWKSRSRSRRPSANGSRSLHSTSLPSNNFHGAMDITVQTPEEQAAIEALMSMGSM